MIRNLLIASAGLVMAAGFSQAGLIYNGGNGTTVYGATQYTCPGAPGACTAAGAQYINNNVTGKNDILSSPGSGYQVANPVVGNNVAQTPNGGMGLGGVSNATPYTFWWSGGASGDGSVFGDGYTQNAGPQVGFLMDDTTVGCCTASYMVTSWQADYTAGAGGFAGPVNSFLGIAGNNTTGSDASVASLIVSYSINGGAAVQMTPMLLALGGNCNDVLGGDQTVKINAACTNGGTGGNFAAEALDTSANLNLNLGDTLDFTATMTVYADPSTIDSIPFNSDGLSLSAPSTLVLGDSSAAPEPGTLLLLGAGLASIGLLRRRKA